MLGAALGLLCLDNMVPASHQGLKPHQLLWASPTRAEPPPEEGTQQPASVCMGTKLTQSRGEQKTCFLSWKTSSDA